MTEFGEQLRFLLKERDMTQKELAYSMGVSKQIISAYVTGERMPSVEHLINIAYVLGCDLNELVSTKEMVDSIDI